MTTKTLTIMEDAYRILASHKLKNESFSETIRRLLSGRKKKDIKEFFGVISEEEGKRMLEDLEKIRAENIGLINQRIS